MGHVLTANNESIKNIVINIRVGPAKIQESICKKYNNEFGEIGARIHAKQQKGFSNILILVRALFLKAICCIEKNTF
jgi:hypothetical protein